MEHKIQTLSSTSELAQRKLSEIENKSLRIAQEKELISTELKNQREAHRAELENMRSSGDFLRKSVSAIQGQLNGATSEAFEMKFNYDEMIRNLEGFKRELRRISENLSAKSKEKNRFKNLHEEGSHKESELVQKNMSLQMEILELTSICKQYENENSILKAQFSSTTDVFGETLAKLNNHLQARSTADSIIKETQIQNEQLIEKNQRLQSQLVQLETELACTQQTLKTATMAYEHSRNAVDSQLGSIKTYTQLFEAVDGSLSDILNERKLAISEATKTITPSYIHSLQQQVVSLQGSLDKANTELAHLQAQHSLCHQHPPGGAQPNASNASKRSNQQQNQTTHASTTTKHLTIPIPPPVQPLPQSTLLSNLRPKTDRRQGKKFCDRCGTLVKPKEPYLECAVCHTASHTKCITMKAGETEFKCDDCK